MAAARDVGADGVDGRSGNLPAPNSSLRGAASRLETSRICSETLRQAACRQPAVSAGMRTESPSDVGICARMPARSAASPRSRARTDAAAASAHPDDGARRNWGVDLGSVRTAARMLAWERKSTSCTRPWDRRCAPRVLRVGGRQLGMTHYEGPGIRPESASDKPQSILDSSDQWRRAHGARLIARAKLQGCDLAGLDDLSKASIQTEKCMPAHTHTWPTTCRKKGHLVLMWTVPESTRHSFRSRAPSFSIFAYLR